MEVSSESDFLLLDFERVYLLFKDLLLDLLRRYDTSIAAILFLSLSISDCFEV